MWKNLMCKETNSLGWRMGPGPFSAQAKRAFVARNAVQNHAARLYKILRAQVNAAIFRSMGAAERWIGP